MVATIQQAPVDGGVIGVLLIIAALATPTLLLAMCLSRRLRERVPAFLAFAPLPALAAATLSLDGSALVLDPLRLQITLALSGPRAMLLGVAALLWSAAGAYTTTYLRDDPRRVRFSVYWLLCMIGCLGVFLAGDLASFYFLYAVVSIAAFGLVVHDGTPGARRAAAIYLALAIFGEACLLLAFVLLAMAAPGESLRIDHVVAAIATSPHRTQAIVFLLLGFGLKAGLFPLHGWLPLAHPAAPMPGSAVLSGAIIKTGVIGLILFIPLDGSVAGWGGPLVVIGFVTAFYGVLVGVTQGNPKTVLAYSSVSQMGVVAAVVGMGVSAAGGESAALAATFYASHHVLVKGALFLGVGVIAMTGRRWLGPSMVAMAVLALSIAGLPLTGGALAKLATKPFLGDGFIGMWSIASAVGSAMLMTHFLLQVASIAVDDRRALAPAGLVAPWLVTAVAAVIVPWGLFAAATGSHASAALAPAELWSSTWPVAVGAAMAFALRLAPAALPVIPEGDILCVGERAARAVIARGGVVDPIDRELRRWSVAGALLAALLLTLGAMIAHSP